MMTADRDNLSTMTRIAKSPHQVNIMVKFLPLLVLYLILICTFAKDSFHGDEADYVRFAKNLSHGYYSPPDMVDLWFGPGYPLVLLPFVLLDLPWGGRQRFLARRVVEGAVDADGAEQWIPGVLLEPPRGLWPAVRPVMHVAVPAVVGPRGGAEANGWRDPGGEPLEVGARRRGRRLVAEQAGLHRLVGRNGHARGKISRSSCRLVMPPIHGRL